MYNNVGLKHAPCDGCRQNMNDLRYELYTSSIIRYRIIPLIYTKMEVLDTILSFYTYKTRTGKVILGNVSFMARCTAFGGR